MKSFVFYFSVVAFVAFISVACRSDDFAPPVAPVSEEVRLETSAGTLYGTLKLPAAEGPFPVALIIAGSGPTDRNGNSPAGVNSNYLLMMADSLARAGIASLRYDKRGIAASQAAAGEDESKLRFDDYVQDAVQWIEQLRSDERLSSIAIIGHSEGSLIGMLAAQTTNPAAFVSLAGAARPADSLILDQLSTQPDEIRREVASILNELRQGRTVDAVNPMLLSLFRPSVQPYLISWIRHHPSDIINQLGQPVLVVQGTTDLQVPEAAGKQLAAAQSNAQLVIVEDMNHVLKQAPADQAANFATYSDPALPLATGLMPAIIGFLKQHP